MASRRLRSRHGGLLGVEGQRRTAAERTDRLEAVFGSAKAHWRPVFDALIARLDVSGADTARAATDTDTCVRLLRGTRKFALAQLTAACFDLGLKLEGEQPSGRFEASGSWNSTVTLRVRLASAAATDTELVHGPPLARPAPPRPQARAPRPRKLEIDRSGRDRHECRSISDAGVDLAGVGAEHPELRSGVRRMGRL